MIKFLKCIFETSGQGRSMDFNRRHGRYYVKYPDGSKSQPFCLDVARDYADIFGGIVLDMPTRGRHAVT